MCIAPQTLSSFDYRHSKALQSHRGILILHGISLIIIHHLFTPRSSSPLPPPAP